MFWAIPLYRISLSSCNTIWIFGGATTFVTLRGWGDKAYLTWFDYRTMSGRDNGVERGVTLSALALIFDGSISKRPESAGCFLILPLLTDRQELSVGL